MGALFVELATPEIEFSLLSRAEEVAAIGVGNRQRMALRAIMGTEPALGVYAPDGVGPVASAEGARDRWDPRPLGTSRCGEATAAEDLADGARARQRDARIGVAQPGVQLARTPPRMELARRHQDDPRRAGMWSPRALPRRTDVEVRLLVATDPLVTAFPAHPVDSAELGHVHLPLL